MCSMLARYVSNNLIVQLRLIAIKFRGIIWWFDLLICLWHYLKSNLVFWKPWMSVLNFTPLALQGEKCVCVFQGVRKSGLFSTSTTSLPAFSSLFHNTEDKDLTLRPSCTLGPDTAITADSTSTTGTTHHSNHSIRAHVVKQLCVWVLGLRS